MVVYRGGVPGWVWYQGGYTGVGNTGVYYPATWCPQGGPHDSEAGPGTPAGGGVGGQEDRVRPSSQTTTPLRSGPAPLSGTSPRAIPASGPIRARFQSIFSKVKQNRRVSPKSMQKASHSPYFQNGPQKSPLELLRFPFSSAFSHKELIDLFWPYP